MTTNLYVSGDLYYDPWRNVVYVYDRATKIKNKLTHYFNIVGYARYFITNLGDQAFFVKNADQPTSDVSSNLVHLSDEQVANFLIACDMSEDLWRAHLAVRQLVESLWNR